MIKLIIIIVSDLNARGERMNKILKYVFNDLFLACSISLDEIPAEFAFLKIVK